MTQPEIDVAGAPALHAAAGAIDAVKTYGIGENEVRALDGITIALERGRFTAIMGPSGSGKSTLMHCLAGLDALTSGAVYIGGTYLAKLNDKELTELRRAKVGFVFQAYNLIPTLSAQENISLPLMLGGQSADTAWFDEVVTTVGLKDRLKHRPSELSGGQQQRVAVARALATKPEIIFADEPTGNLDSRAGAEILEFMRRAVREYGQTIVIVTHDPVAAAYADRVVFLADGKIVDEMLDPTSERVLDRMKQLGGEHMSTRSTALIARKSIRARVGRLIAIAVAIVVGVSFVVASFVLADSLRSAFDNLFTQISQDVDLEVRASVAFEQGSGTQDRDPIPADLVEQVQAVEGVGVIEPFLQRYAQFVDREGEPITTQGAPLLGVAWTGDASLSGLQIKDEGRPPGGPEEVAMDKATADREDFVVGDRIEVLTDTGTHEFTITALVGVGDSDGFSGATLAAWDVPTAQAVLGAEGEFDGVDVQAAAGTDVATLTAAIEEVLPPGTEIVTREVLIEESKADVDTFIGPFGTGLLIFAFITAFVSAFLINNVFAITIGQRLRELALMRAVGASGAQVRRMIYVEAIVMSAIATVIGIGAGIFVAKGIVALFNSAGAGFPDSGSVLLPRTVVMAFVVGVGITLLAVVLPARRAARIPPVAAMRPELGFEAMSARRLVVGTVVTILGALMFLLGLFVRPGGTPGTIALAGGGGLLLFLGVASLSSTIARPVTRLIGWPVAKVYGTPGALARENAGRAPRRTSATASALMIGVALVSAASVFAASLRSTFQGILERGVTADLLILPGGQDGRGLPPIVAQTLSGLPEVAAVSPIRGVPAQIEGDQKFLGAGDPTVLPQLINIDIETGSYDGLDELGILVHKDPAADLDLRTGDVLPVTFQSGTELDLTVVGIFNDASLAGNWLIALSTLDQATTTAPSDFFIPLKLATDFDAVTGRQAVETAMTPFPQVEVQSNAEFREELEGQIDQLLIVITVLLALAIVIAVFGISITLALGVFERTHEIGLMRAVGMTKRQTRRTVRWEAVIVATFGAIVGIVVGSLIGIALCLAVPNTVVDGIAFSLPTIVIILIGAVVAGLVAALYPSYKASNLDVLRAIATE